MFASRRLFMFIFSTLTIFAGQKHYYPAYRETNSSRLRKQNPKVAKSNYFEAQVEAFKTSVDRIDNVLTKLKSTNKKTVRTLNKEITPNNSSLYLPSYRSSLDSVNATPKTNPHSDSIDKTINKPHYSADKIAINAKRLASFFPLNLNKETKHTHPCKPQILPVD